MIWTLVDNGNNLRIRDPVTGHIQYISQVPVLERPVDKFTVGFIPLSPSRNISQKERKRLARLQK